MVKIREVLVTIKLSLDSSTGTPLFVTVLRFYCCRKFLLLHTDFCICKYNYLLIFHINSRIDLV